MKILLRRLTVAVAALSLVASTAACSTVVEPDNIGLYYTGGSRQGSKFQECIDPGTTGPYPVNDNVYFLPTSGRTWNIAKEGGDTNVPIEAPTKPTKAGAGPVVKMWVKADFFLNTDCEKKKGGIVKEFWEELGRRYGADIDPAQSPEEWSKDPGWLNMMTNVVVPALLKAVQDISRQYEADPLVYNIGGIWTKIQEDIGKGFTAELIRSNGQFFCGPSYKRNAGVCDPPTILLSDVDFANAAIQAARDDVRTETERAAARLIKAQSELDYQQKLGALTKDPNYMAMRRLELELEKARLQLQAAEACSRNPECTLIVGVGAEVTVPAR